MARRVRTAARGGSSRRAPPARATEETLKRDAADHSQAVVMASVYEDPEVQEALPFADELLQAVQQARPRPVSPVYALISQAIYENVNATLSGRQSPEQALQRAQTQIEHALEDLLIVRGGG